MTTLGAASPSDSAALPSPKAASPSAALPSAALPSAASPSVALPPTAPPFESTAPPRSPRPPGLLEFDSIEALRKHHHSVMLEEGRRLRQHHLYCQRLAVQGMVGGLVGGVVVAYGVTGQLERAYPRLFGQRRYGRGLVVGAVGSVSAFVVGKYLHDTCMEMYIQSMRSVAEQRHRHYMNQLLSE